MTFETGEELNKGIKSSGIRFSWYLFILSLRINGMNPQFFGYNLCSKE